MNTLDTRTKNLLTVVLGMLALFLLIQSIAALAGIEEKDNMMPANVITVRGMGEALATPDIATFSFTVREQGKDVAATQKTMTDKSNKAIAYLKEKNIAEKDIKTESYYTNPQYDYRSTICRDGYCPPSKPILSGYEVAMTVSVKVRDVAKAGELLTGIAELKIGEVSALSFTIDDMETLKTQAKKQAIAKAKAEAEEIANALGVDLERIVSFYEEYPYDRPYGGEMDASMSSVKVQNTSASPDIRPGEQKVTANVSITFEVED